MRKYQTEDNVSEFKSWVKGYNGWKSGFYIEKAGYFDERPVIHTTVTQLMILFALPFLAATSLWFLFLLPLTFWGWGQLFIYLPIKTGIQDCESAKWGINYHDNTFWIYIGGGGNFEGGTKWVTFDMPWALTWVRTSLLLKNKKSWVHETKDNKIEFYNKEWKNPELVFIETHPYKYVLKSGKEQDVEATIQVEEREWRYRWLTWLPMFKKIRRTIDINFSKEVGERTGSWKGGVTGCSYRLLDGETPLECLRRMEKERKFN